MWQIYTIFKIPGSLNDPVRGSSVKMATQLHRLLVLKLETLRLGKGYRKNLFNDSHIPTNHHFFLLNNPNFLPHH